MNDRFRDGFDGSASDADIDPAVAADLDRQIDAWAAGKATLSGDPLFALFDRARADLDTADDVPAPDINALLAAGGAGEDAVAGAPDAAGDADTTVIPITRAPRHRRRRRGLGLTGRAAAAGGISVTGMVIAGGVAAALAVGGFGVAAYHGAIPGIPARDEVSDGQVSGDTSTTQKSPHRRPSTSAATSTEPTESTAGSAGPSSEAPVETTDPAEPTGTEPTDGPGSPTRTTDPSQPSEPTGSETVEPTEDPTEPTDSPEPTDTDEPESTNPGPAQPEHSS